MEYTLEELHNMFDKEQKSRDLHKIMSAMVEKHDVLFDDNEETNHVQLEKYISK